MMENLHGKILLLTISFLLTGFSLFGQALSVNCPGNQVLTYSSGCSGALPDYTTLATATGGTPPYSVTQTPVAGATITGNVTTAVSIMAMDALGQMATCTFDVNSFAGPAPASVTASPANICPGGTVQLNATTPGLGINWYTVPTGGTSIGSSLSGANFAVNPAGPTTYYAEAVISGSGGGGSGSQTFNFTGTSQSFTVPPGVSSIAFDVSGAQGGSNGGLGGNVTGVLPVIPGQVLEIYVGGQGGNSNLGVVPGGFNGGGNSGNSSGNYYGSGGGGASDIRQGGNTLNDRVVVAGGGGGSHPINSPSNAGAGGGLIGGSVTSTGNGCLATYATGGTQTAGGVPATSTGVCCTGVALPGGSFGIGGDGQGPTTNCNSGDSGSGGGGGWYGGGGGFVYSSGGGGSSYTASNVTNVVHTQGSRTGNGQIILSWTGGASCVSERVPVTVNTVTVTPPSNVTATPSVFCPGTTVQLNATTNGDSVVWYTVPTGGTPIGSSLSGVNFPVNPSVTTTYYAESVIGGGGGGGGTNSIVTSTVQQGSLTLPYSPGSTPIGVVWNPQFSLYYASTGGSTGVPLVTYDANGVQLSSVTGNFDFRGSWWNSNTNKFEANSYSNTGYRANDLDVNGWALGSGIVSPAGQNQPDPQSQGGYDPVNDEVVFYNAGQIERRNRITGGLVAGGAITGLPAGNINNYWASFSGVPGAEIMIFDYTNRAVRFIDRTTFAYTSSVQLSASAPAPASWSLGYDGNGTLWIHNGTEWTSWEVVNIGSGGGGACTSTRVPVTVTASPNPPVISCPGTQTLTLTPNCAGTLPDYTTLATVAPGCAGPMTVTQSPVAGTTVTGSGLMTITLTATDASNITATCSFTVNKVDTNPPTIVCPANQTLPLSANCSVTLPDYTLQATASDVCPGAVVITQSPAAGTILSGQGATTVTLTATDAGNNTATCSFTVNRVDTSPPSLICPATQSLVLSPNCAAVLPDYTLTVSATDACTGAAAVTQSPAPGTAYSGIGSMTVTLTATDGNNNSTSCSFTVNRVDNIAPLLTCPSNQTLSLGASCSAVLPDYTGMSAATDNCGAVTLTQTPAAGTSVSGSGAITVTVTATDLDNNITTCTFTVTKTDNTAPVPNVATLPAINGECSVSVNAPSATDDCSGTVTATTNDPLIYTSPGTYTINWTYSDLSGNVSTQTQTVTVSPVSVNASSNSPVCIGASVNLSASSLSNGTYQWVGPNNFSSNQQNPLVSNPANGNYIVSFTSSLNPNCNVTDTVAVTISPLPTPVITQNGTLLSTGTYLTYQWFKNGFAINGATSQTHNATSNGLYSVQVTDQNGCTATSSLINVTNVSITPIINDRLSVYPNPVKDQVSIVLTDLKPNTFAKLYNALGQTLMTIPLSTEKSDVGLQTLAKGVYTLEVWENGDRTGIIQLIKE